MSGAPISGAPISGAPTSGAPTSGAEPAQHARPAARLGVRLVGVAKAYGATAALRDVSLEVAPGEFLTLLGPSGCGKTTLLRMIAGFVRPDVGSVWLGDVEITHTPINRRPVGMVFQHYALFPHLTVRDNVSFGLRMRGTHRDEIERVVRAMVSLVGLTGLETRYPHQLSGGQQQRVALARILAVQPGVLLLDEPFGALDKNLRLQMQVEVKQLVRRLGITTVFVTHDQEEALTMSDRLAVMDAGRIVQLGTPTEVYDRPATPFVAQFIGEANMLPGRVEPGEGGRPVGRIADWAFTLPRDTPLGPAILMVRPENLSLEGEPRADAAASTVRLVMTLGPGEEYRVALPDGHELKVRRSRSRLGSRASGDRVWVRVADPDAVMVYPSDGPPFAPAPPARTPVYEEVR